MLASDLIGVLAGLLLLVAPARDQYFRYAEYRQKDKATRSVVAALRQDLGDVWKHRRDAFSGVDSLTLFAGAAGLVLSYLLKLGGL